MLVNVVGSLRIVWYDVVQKIMDVAQIFDLGDGQSSRSGNLHPPKVGSSQKWLWYILGACRNSFFRLNAKKTKTKC